MYMDKILIMCMSLCPFTVTLLSAVIMFTLFVSELNYYLTKEVHPELFVDTSRGQKLRINVDITFHHLPCACKYTTEAILNVENCSLWNTDMMMLIPIHNLLEMSPSKTEVSIEFINKHTNMLMANKALPGMNQNMFLALSLIITYFALSVHTSAFFHVCMCVNVLSDFLLKASSVFFIKTPDLSVDAMDISGEQQIDLETNLLKQRLDSTGNPINETPQEQS